MPGPRAATGAGEPPRPGGAPRPRLGLLLCTSGWFRDVGLQGASSETSREVERAGAGLAASVGAFADTVYQGVVFSTSDAERAARRILEEGVDGVLLAPLMWCEDAIPRAALALLKDLPLLLWTWSPEGTVPAPLAFQDMLRGSGAVCTMQLSGMLRREGRPFRSVAGQAGGAEVLAELASLARAMAVSRRLRGARIGLLPFPCDQMSATWVDEFGLRATLGIEVRHLELERFRLRAAAVGDAELQAFRRGLEARGARIEVDERNLGQGARIAIAMEAIMTEEGLSALAMNDVIPEMHRSFGLRPCLSNPALSASGAVVSMEADLGAATAMLALRLLTGGPPFYTEPLYVDHASGSLIMGHAGYHDPSNADPAVGTRIVPDIEYENSDPFTGAASFFKHRPGPVTAVNSVWDGTRLRLACVEGESLPGPPRLEGNCHLDFRPDLPVARFLNLAVGLGVSQHWVFTEGRRAGEVAALAEVLGLGFVRLGS